jgi:hypothetical protein
MKYPTYEEVQNSLEKTAPNGWIVTDEYHFIGVNHSSFTQRQFISVGDVNGHFGFNDEDAMEISGDMEKLYDADEIAESFWNQILKFYPQLMEVK